MVFPSRIAVATRNEHKLGEIARICAGWPVTWLTIRDHDGPWPDVEETGDTYVENALLDLATAGIDRLTQIQRDALG